MNSSETPIHQDFAPWYRVVSLDNNTELVRARWDGVQNFLCDVDEQGVEALLRLAYATRQQPDESLLQNFREKFKEHDEAFDMSGNMRELQVLAAASLAVLMADADAQHAELAAISVSTADFSSGRKPDLPMNLKTLSENAISLLGELSRTRPELEFSNALPKIDDQPALEKIAAQQNWEGVKQAFTAMAETVGSGMGRIVNRYKRNLGEISSFVKVQDEELKMLWWLIGQYSDVYGCEFKRVPVLARPFVFADDLADFTVCIPGPPSIKGILSRAGLKARKKVIVADAVNSCDQGWLKSLVSEADPSPVSTPLHFALKRQLETGPGDAWVAGWAAAVGVNENYAVPELTLAELFYRERLILHFS